MAVALSWSGGKDSALALAALRREGREPVALLTTVTEPFDRISMHGVRRTLLTRQAEAAGLPLVETAIPSGCGNELDERRVTEALAGLVDVDEVAFGDLFLEDVRAYRERLLATTGHRCVFPIWGSDTGELARAFLAQGFEARLTCIDPRRLDASYAGRAFDAALLRDLPPGVDPCGENGEFHTFVHTGPVFRMPVACTPGEVVERDGFVFCDLAP